MALSGSGRRGGFGKGSIEGPRGENTDGTLSRLARQDHGGNSDSGEDQGKGMGVVDGKRIFSGRCLWMQVPALHEV